MKNPFRTPSHEDQLSRALERAKHDLLSAESHAEYWQAMRQMLEDRVRRLALQTPAARGGLR